MHRRRWQVDGAGIQDVPVDTPLEMANDWLLLQSRVCSRPLSEIRLAEDVDDKWTSYKQTVAPMMREVIPTLAHGVLVQA